jgi:hypothetical protein
VANFFEVTVFIAYHPSCPPPPLFSPLFFLNSLAHVVSSLAYPNLLRTKRLDYCCCCCCYRFYSMRKQGESCCEFCTRGKVVLSKSTYEFPPIWLAFNFWKAKAAPKSPTKGSPGLWDVLHHPLYRLNPKPLLHYSLKK